MSIMLINEDNLMTNQQYSTAEVFTADIKTPDHTSISKKRL